MPDPLLIPGVPYDPAVPTQAEVLGYEPGERLSSPEQIERYLRALAQASPRLEVQEYGRSTEGRPLLHAVISDPANLERQREVRAALGRLADPRATSLSDAEELISELPTVSWVIANIHGGEHSSAEGAVLLAYHLAAAEDDLARRIRRESLVVIDPLQNPDGRARSVSWYYAAFGIQPNPDRLAAEHFRPYPGPRGNHYHYDLNRDWIFLTQAESAARVRAHLRWHPQLVCDLHEMWSEASFFFFPPAEPVHRQYPEGILRWWEIYGREMADWFDRFGWEYFTQERFNALYPGYGEAWPSFHGASGMTFEQGSPRSLAIERQDGSQLTLRDALRRQFVASLASCAVSAVRRQERLRDYYEFHAEGIRSGAEGLRAYLLPPQPAARPLMENLHAQGIEVHLAGEAFTVPARAFLGEETADREFPAGTFVVRLDQPYARFVRALLEPRTELSAEFLREETEARERRLPDRFYDVSAWSRPLAVGLQAFETEAEVTAPLAPLAEAPRAPARVEAAPLGYVLPAGSPETLAVADQLLRQGHPIRLARRRFRLAERECPAGSLFLPGGDERLADDLRAALDAARDELPVLPVTTHWTEDGIDLGSVYLPSLKPARVAVLYDWPTGTLSFGWLAWLLEQRYRIPFTAVRRTVLGGEEDFRPYDVLVLPDGRDYARAFDDGFDEWLRGWVRQGGVAVGFGQAAAWLARPEAELTTARAVRDLRELPAFREDGEPAPADSKEPVPHEFQPSDVPGCFLNVNVDTDHPLAGGYPAAFPAFYEGSLVLTPSQAGWNVVTVAPAFQPASGQADGPASEQDAVVASGFVWERLRRALAGSAYLVDEPCGRGRVILFAQDPGYRCAWDSLHGFLLNALLVSPFVKREG